MPTFTTLVRGEGTATHDISLMPVYLAAFTKIARMQTSDYAAVGVPATGLGTFMEQTETAQRLAGRSFGVGGVPFWGKLRASMEQWEVRS